MFFLTLKCKIDSENGLFKPACTENALFMLTQDPKAKGMFLIYDKCVAIFKEGTTMRNVRPGLTLQKD